MNHPISRCIAASLVLALLAPAAAAAAVDQDTIAGVDTLWINDNASYPATGGWHGQGIADTNKTSDNGWGKEVFYVDVCVPRTMRFIVENQSDKPGHYWELWVDGALIDEQGVPSGWGDCFAGIPPAAVDTFDVALGVGEHKIRIRDAGFDGHTDQEISDNCMLQATARFKWSWLQEKIIVKGRFMFNDSIAGANAPLREARVALIDVDSGADDSLAFTYTDADGYFYFPCRVNADEEGGGRQDLKVSAMLITRPRVETWGTVWPFQVTRQDTSVWTFDSRIDTASASVSTTDWVLDFGLVKPADTNYSVRSAMYLYDTMWRGRDWIDARRDTSDINEAMTLVTVLWDWEVGTSTFFEFKNGRRYINIAGAGDAQTARPDEWDRSVILHEYGHAVASRYQFVVDSSLTSHSGTEALSATYYSWSEGWATFFGCITQTPSGNATFKDVGWDKNDSGNRTSWTLNAETVEYTPSSGSGDNYNDHGDLWEWSVAGALWDVWDSANDNRDDQSCGDSYTEGTAHTKIFTVCLQMKDSPGTGRDIYNFQNRYTVEYSSDASALCDVMCEHGVEDPDCGNLQGGGGGQLAVRPAPLLFALHTPEPNPTRGATLFAFDLPHGGVANLEVFDAHGRRVRTILPGVWLPAGSHSLTWDGADHLGLPSQPGVYFYRLRVPGNEATRRLVVVH